MTGHPGVVPAHAGKCCTSFVNSGDPYAGPSNLARWSKASRLQLKPVVMGPCVRRDDERRESPLDTPAPRFVNRFSGLDTQRRPGA
jgi:hypothetical protein